MTYLHPKPTRDYWTSKKQTERESLKKRGFVLKQHWIHRDEVQAVEEFLRTLKMQPRKCP